MSNSYAIAAVTATLRQMIDDGFNKDPDFNNNLPDSLKFGGKIDVTTNTLDQAHDENKGKIELMFVSIWWHLTPPGGTETCRDR